MADYKFNTKESKQNVPFWYQYKPFIYDKDGDMELQLIDNSHINMQVEDFNFEDPQFDPINLSSSMVKLMRKRKGVGLSACQVGIPINMFVMEGEPAFAVFNPRITYYGEEQVLLDEGCLSFPGLFLKIKRPRFIRVRFRDPYGDYVTKQFDGMSSRVFQHEMDHCSGVDFRKKVGKLKLDMAIKKLEKQRSRNGRQAVRV